MEGEKLREAVIAVFSDAQAGLHHQQKLRKSLKKVYDEGRTENEFLEVFIGLLKHALVVFKREPAVDRLINFAGYFVANSGEEFVLKFLQETLTPFHAARDKAVRFRVSQLANKIVEHMSDDVEINNDLYRTIYKAAMVLAFDKVYQIRIQGILLLRSIQDVEDDDCPVMAAMLDRMQKDNNHEVRKCALQNVAGTLVSLPYILERTRDVKDTVRKAAYSVVAKKFLIQNLSISKRIQILKDGLNDTSPSVKDACVMLLMSWLSSFDGNLLELVERLDVEGSPEVTQMALELVFKVIGSDELVAGVCTLMHDKDQTTVDSETEDEAPENIETAEKETTADKELSNVVAYNFLTSDVAFFWSILCSYYNGLGDKGEEYLCKIIPTPFEFAAYLKGFLDNYLFPAKDEGNIREFLSIAKHLFSLTELLDLSDEFGRQKLAEFFCHTLSLPDCSVELAAVIVEHMFCLWPQKTLYIEKLVGVISEIRQPMECVNLPPLDEPDEPVIPAVEHDLAINNTVSTDTSTLEDPKVLQKCLIIAHKLYSKLHIQKLGPALLTLLDTLVLPCVQNEEPAIRNLAFMCLGSASLLDIDQAHKYLHLLLQVSQIDHEMIQATALRMVFDILLLYGIDTFKSAAVSGTNNDEQPGDDDVMTMHSFADEANDNGKDGVDQTTQILLKILLEFLGNESVMLREIAGEGLSKLLYCGRVLSQRILARLLLLWFNPIIEDDTLLRSLLGTFFPAFAASDRAHAECFYEVFVPVLSTVLEAPETSPLAAVDANNMADFLLSITTPKTPSENGHNTLAVSVCHKVVGCCEADTPVDVYCRALSRMILTKDDESSLISLHVLLSEVKKNVSGRQNLKYLEKFSTMLSKLCPPPPPTAGAVESSSPSILDPAPTPANNCTPAITSRSTRTSRRTKGKTAAADKENIPQSEKFPKSTGRAVRSKQTAKVPVIKNATVQKEQAQGVLSGNSSEPEDTDILNITGPLKKSNIKSRLRFEDDTEDVSSDDSYLEHDSPFVKHTKSKTSKSKEQQQLLLSSEDNT